MSALGVLLAANLAGAQPPDQPPAEEEAPVDLTGEGQLGPPPPAQTWAPRPSPYRPPPPASPPAEPPEDEGEPHGGTQRNFGFGPRIAGIWAFGAGARAGHRYFGADVSGGWQPLVPTVQPASGDAEMELHHSWQLTLMAYLAFNPDSTFVAGATAGYSYNSILGRGVVLAFDGVLNFSNHLGFHFHAGPGFYPDAADRMAEAIDLPKDSEITSAPAFQMAFGVGLIIYP